MKQLQFILILTGLLTAYSAGASHPEKDYDFRITQTHIQHEGNRLNIDFTIDCQNLNVPSNDQLFIQPQLIGPRDTVKLPVVLFPGKIRDKANKRKAYFYGPDSLQPFIYQVVKPGSGLITVHYNQTLPFQEWMYGARLELQQEVYGCADCHKTLAAVPVYRIENRPRVAFIVPAPETQRTEKSVLYVRFPWDQAVILKDFGNNAEELDKIGQSLQKVYNQRPSSLNGMQLTGYASPEGAYNYNARLAGRRVQALKNYIRDKYALEDRIFTVDTVPEDWDNVRRKVDSSDLQYRTQVLNIIDRTANPDARDRQIRQLDGSKTYHHLLHTIYPPLRRVEYVIHYRTEPLNAAEAARVMQRDPEQLTPYELYEVAQTYPPASPEFKAIILTSVRLYPQNAVTNNNAAAIALQNNDIEEAARYLQLIGEEPLAQNNRGVLLLLTGSIPEAIHCFRTARDYGSPEAAYNLQQAIPEQLGEQK